MKGSFVVYWLIDFNEKHSIVQNVFFFFLQTELSVPLTCFQIRFKKGDPVVEEGPRPFGITTNMIRTQARTHTSTPESFIHTHTQCFNPSSFSTPNCVIACKENSKSVTMTEKEGKRYLDEEGEGWEDGMEDFVLTMQQYSTLYSHGIKRGSVIWLQERVCVCVCMCERGIDKLSPWSVKRRWWCLKSWLCTNCVDLTTGNNHVVFVSVCVCVCVCVCVDWATESNSSE